MSLFKVEILSFNTITELPGSWEKDDLLALLNNMDYADPEEIKDAELKSYNQDKSLGTYQKVGTLTVNIYQDELDRNKCDIKKGDYIGIQTDTNHMEYFSVFNDGRVNFANTQNMNGYKPFFRTISAASVDKNEFNGE